MKLTNEFNEYRNELKGITREELDRDWDLGLLVNTDAEYKDLDRRLDADWDLDDEIEIEKIWDAAAELVLNELAK